MERVITDNIVYEISTAPGLEQWIRYLIANNRLHEFYTSSAWLRLRQQVLIENRFECQHCKAKGYYHKADTVHHVQHVKKHPALALSRIYEHNGKTYANLVPLCHKCHEEAHEFRKKKNEPLTPERW